MNINEKIAIVIPTCNGEETIEQLLRSIKVQDDKYDVLVIDSESDDATLEILMRNSIKFKSIKRSNFNHGKTRQWGVELCENAEIIVFLTQDAILAKKESIKRLVECFGNENIGCSYGRQIPHKNADILAAHARLFNYPKQSRIKEMKNSNELGIKTAFISNSFAAYRRSALLDVGGFPEHVNLSEDTYVAAKMLIKNWKIAYCAEALVYHSHNYTIWEEFKRYFDIGVFHKREAWIRNAFGDAEGEGKKFIVSEINYVIHRKKKLLPLVIIRSAIKYIGYRLGMREEVFSVGIKRELSMNKMYWTNQKEREM